MPAACAGGRSGGPKQPRKACPLPEQGSQARRERADEGAADKPAAVRPGRYMNHAGPQQEGPGHPRAGQFHPQRLPGVQRGGRQHPGAGPTDVPDVGRVRVPIPEEQAAGRGGTGEADGGAAVPGRAVGDSRYQGVLRSRGEGRRRVRFTGSYRLGYRGESQYAAGQQPVSTGKPAGSVSDRCAQRLHGSVSRARPDLWEGWEVIPP
jgi:hypothetical protein